MATVYSTRVTARGGRGGTATSDDGLLEVKLAMPKALGGDGRATNPEQLFAAGYAACFGNAVLHVARRTHKIADADVVVTAEVALGANADGSFGLSVKLETMIAGIDQATAEALTAEAHRVCPYSNAVRGNIMVAISVTTR
jgi:Ohr subfamily peroxiredoxin